MKHTISILISALALVMVACNTARVIPDKELGAIFRDAMLVNAYLAIHDDVKIDSMNIYEPIFERYGYTAEDVQYTIHNFSQRKSANLSDVAEHMILLLDREASELNREAAKLDTIDRVAERRFTRTVLADSAIKVRTAADSVRMRFVVEPLPVGMYHINATYTLDSLDTQGGRNYRIYAQRRDSSTYRVAGAMVLRRKRAEIMQSFENTDTSFVRLVLEMSHFSRPRKDAITRMDIHDIKITHMPPTERCVELLFEEQSGLRIFSDSLIRAIEEVAAK